MGNIVIGSFEDVIVKNVRCGKYKSRKSALQLIKYISGNSIIPEKQKPVRYTGGYGVPVYNPDLCCEAMYIIKKLYRKTSPKLRCIYHFIVSFPACVDDINIVKLISIDLCQYFYHKNYQCMYGVHNDTENLHIHIAVNSTSFISGKQMDLSINELKALTNDLKKRAFGILKENGF